MPGGKKGCAPKPMVRLVTAVLVVTFGRIGDIFGRVRMYNLGFAVFTVASIALSLTPGSGGGAAPGTVLLTCDSAVWGLPWPDWRASSLRAGALWLVGGSQLGFVHPGRDQRTGRATPVPAALSRHAELLDGDEVFEELRELIEERRRAKRTAVRSERPR